VKTDGRNRNRQQAKALTGIPVKVVGSLQLRLQDLATAIRFSRLGAKQVHWMILTSGSYHNWGLPTVRGQTTAREVIAAFVEQTMIAFTALKRD
jgi:hypothetical protein